MFSFIRQTFCQWARTGTRVGAQRPAVRRLECEALEDRMLLSLSGAQLFANSLGAASQAAVASSPGGRSVVAWTVANTPQDHDIKAQLFDAGGHKVGGEILVAGGRENQYAPTVAVNAAGEFVVAWTMDFSQTDTDVHATLFRADDTRVADDFNIAATYKREFAASAGIDARGDFVVSYTFQFGPGDTDVKAAQFDAGAHALRTIDVAVTPRVEANSHVSVAADGSFAVSYTSDGAALLKAYSSAGQFLGTTVGSQGTGSHPLPPPHHVPPPPPPHHVPPPPPPHHVPPPATLSGTIAGGYLAGAGNVATGARSDLVGIGYLTGLGESVLTGDLIATGQARSGHATGVLTLRDANGSVTLQLQGSEQGAFGHLPYRFHFTVGSGTGTFAHLHASGTATLQLMPGSHTFTMAFTPVIS